jgi:primosomal protein N'
VTGAEVYLLTHSPAFQPFSYALPAAVKAAPGDIVAVPFRGGIEAGVISSLTRLSRPDDPQIKPVLVKLNAPCPHTGFGKLLLALAHLNLCSPGEIFTLALWGQQARLFSLELSAGSTAPPQELQDAHKSALMILGKRKARITPGLLKKLTKAVGFTELITLSSCGSLSVTGQAGLDVANDGAERKAKRQADLFPEAEDKITLKAEYALAQEAMLALEKGGSSLPIPGAVIPNVKWRQLASPEGARKHILAGFGMKLLLLPTQWHTAQFLAALTPRQRAAVIAFEPDMTTAEYKVLEERMKAGGPLLVVGNRAAHFLMMHARFDNVFIFDPQTDDYSSGQFPHYNAFADAALLSAATCAPLTLFPQTPLPMGLYRAPLQADVVSLPGQSGARIEKIVEAIAALAKPQEQLLVFNNATGSGQEAHCASCGAKVSCPQCGRPASVDANANDGVCKHCGRHEPLGACQECGSRQLSIDIVGVEALAKRVRAQLRAAGGHPAPRVGVLHRARREKIRVPNLARTDVLIGTSTLFVPLQFYKPQAIVYIAQDTWRVSPYGSPEEAVIEDASRLMSLYGVRGTKLIILAPRALAEAVKAGLGGGGWDDDIIALQKQYGLPPFNVQVGFSIYGQRESTVRVFAEEMCGQLEFASEVLEWQLSRPHPHGGRWALRGSVRLKRYAAALFAELRRRGKGKHIDLVFSPRYY